MKGRPRKPGALRKLQGKSGHRRIPDEPAFASAIPTSPPYLAGEGLKEWNRMARRATELGVTTEADWAIFSNYCYAWQRHFGLATKLEKQTIGDAE